MIKRNQRRREKMIEATMIFRCNESNLLKQYKVRTCPVRFDSSFGQYMS